MIFIDSNNNVANSNTNVSIKWTLKTIREANNRTGFQKINNIITPSIYTTNFLIIVYTWCVFFARIFNYQIPDFLISYEVNPICTVNAILLMVLTNGHDRYYTITGDTLVLSEYIGLQCIDLITKISLFVVSILQCIAIETFIGICFYGYFLTFLRAWYLHKRLNKEHPISKQVEETWYPNNIRHNMVMFIWFLLYYVLLKMNIVYYIICFLNNNPIDFKDPEVVYALYITRLSFIMIFDFYWIYRVLRKVKIKKNTAFKSQNETLLEKEVEEYYANKAC